MEETNPIYSKTNPFISCIKERYPLCKPGSKKNTQHVVIDLKGSGIRYEVGDCIGVFPHNDPDLVNLTLKSLHMTGKEPIGETTLKEFLTYKGNITQFSRKFLSEVAARQPDPL